MPRITFLDNAKQGENNWWRYISTIFLTWVTPMVFELVILIIFLFYVMPPSINMAENLLQILSNPLVLIAILGVSSVISLLFLYISMNYIHQRKFISLINTDSRFSWSRVLKGGIIWFALFTIGILLSLIIDPSGLKITFNPNTFGFLLILSLLVFPIQASFEELFFRGYLMQGFGLLSKKPVVPLILTSIIFAAIHYFNSMNTITSIDIVLQAFIIGITLGIITLGENRIETAMGVHISNNIFASVIANNPIPFTQNLPSVFTLTAPPNPLLDTVGTAVYAFLLLVIIFWGKKENLLGIFRQT